MKQKRSIKRVKNRKFKTGARRDSSDDKPNVHDFLGYTLLRFGYHLKTGERHYGPSNFLKGIPKKVALECLGRHYAKLIAGDKSEDHASAIIFNTQLIMLEEQKEGIKEDHYFEYLGNKAKSQRKKKNK